GRLLRKLGLVLPFLAACWHGALFEGLRPRPRSKAWADLVHAFRLHPPARVVAFRMVTHPAALALLAHWPQASADIDVDDVESNTRISVGGALLRLGRWRAALRETLIGAQYKAVERWASARYRTVWLASPGDCRAFVTRLAANVACRPNRLAIASRAPPGAGSPRDLLFVGTLNYPPNEEAARFLLRHVLPRLQGPAWRLTIAGRHAPPALRQQIDAWAGPFARVELADGPPDLAPFYARAGIVLVPLKAGGGTKFKTLEAFAHGKPVIATTQGVRGLDAVAGRDYLSAETPAQFAAAIARLAADPALAGKLARAGHAMWQSRFQAGAEHA
ncbi:MAG: glycosyltransferase family 4 protein, partial [Chromatiales bacterium]|nr:glycosyltransferase family 4 protein [Chromatiales bacterium]